MPMQVSFDQDEPPEEGGDGDSDEILTEFRERGGRYLFKDARKNHFEIKHWQL